MTRKRNSVSLCVALALAAIPGCETLDGRGYADVTAARNGVKVIALNATVFWQQKGRCPTLKELVTESLVASEQPDPWGHAYRIACANDMVRVISLGPDGVLGSPDDFVETRTLSKK